MARASRAATSAAKPPRAHASVVTAYREGLGLAGIAIVCDAAGARVAEIGASDFNPDVDTNIQIRWWCRRPADAERVASTAALRMRRLELRGGGASSPLGVAAEDSRAFSSARDAVLAAARRLSVLLQSDDEIAAEAAVVAERVDVEVERSQQSGELKSVNQAYRNYRVEATARGEHIVPYAEWMRKYRENLVRQAASALRHI
jgi:hypothetical protein